MHRLSVFVFRVVALVLGALRYAVAAPAINFSIYAPEQRDSPLHIVGLKYEEGFITTVLLNATDKSIAGVEIIGVEQAPLGCGAEPRRIVGVGSSVEPLRIAPRERVVTSGHGAYPGFNAAFLVFDARRFEAASLQFQVGVWEVDFVDGTKWRPHDALPETPFDSSLVDADAGKCPDAADVSKALSTVEGVRFDRRVEKPTYRDDPPRLLFSCSLEASHAFCPL